MKVSVNDNVILLHLTRCSWRIVVLFLCLLLWGSLDAFAIRAVQPKNPCTGDFGSTVSRARYYKPELGRFWTMDSYEGTSQDPLSLHKYLYCAGNPVNGIDPTGRAVYVMTRPLNIKGFEKMGNDACHGYLAFDTDGLSNVEAWENAVRESWDTTRHPNTYGIQYGPGDPDNATFSFHPKSG